MDGKVDPCKKEGDDKAKPGSITYTLPFGGIPYEEGLDAGYLILRERLPTPALFSPAVLFYQHPAAIQLVSLQSSGGNVIATLIGADSIRTEFKTPLGQSFGVPTGDSIGSRQRLQLLDANRQVLPASSSVSAVNFVRIVYADGDQVEVSVSTKRPTRYRASTGRETVFASLPQEVALKVTYKDGALRQIRSSAGLADFVSLGTTGFEIRFYVSANQGAFNATTGLYSPINTPYRTLRFENPFAAAKTYNRMVITDTWGTRVKISTFDYDAVISDWTLRQGSGDEIRKESKTLTPGPLTGQKTYRIVLRNNLDQIISTRDEIWQTNLPWGSELVSEIREPASLNLRTDYDYNYTSASDPNYGRLRRQTNPDGSWEHFTYDAKGRLTTKLSTWKDAPYSADPGTPRVIREYSYASHDPLDVVDDSDFKPRTETESIIPTAGAAPIVTRRSYHVYKFDATGRRVEIEEQAASPAASFGAPGNLRSTRVYFTADPLQPGYLAAAAGRLAYFEDVDGTRVSYTYAINLAVPSEAFVVTAVNSVAAQPDGIDGLSTRTDSYYDLRGRLVRTQSYLRSGGAWIAASNETSTYNDEGFLTATHSNGRQTYGATYDGRLLTSATDEQGVTVSYFYDPLGKVESTVRAAVPASGSYPAQAAVDTIYIRDLGGIDCGCDGQVVTTIAAGSLFLEETNRKDPLGRPQVLTDASGYTTTFDYTLGGLQAHQVNPDASTVVTLRYRDGRLRSVTGTGTIASYHDYGVNADGTRWTEVRSVSSAGPRWQRTTTDFLGRLLKAERPAFDGGTLVSVSTYDALGRLSRQRQSHIAAVTSAETTPVADTVYIYDAMGNLTRTGLDVDGNGLLDLASADRIIDYGSTFAFHDSAWWSVRTSTLYPVTGAATAIQATEQRSRHTGLTGTLAAESVVLDIHGNITRSTTEVDFAAKLVTQSITVPGATAPAVSVSYHGRLVSQSSPTVTAPTTYLYDDLGRPLGVKDPRLPVASTIAYVPGKAQVLSQTDAHGQSTTYAYYPPGVPGAGKVSVVTDALSRTVRTAYDLLGRSVFQWGTATYPQATTYDAYGALETLTTWRDTGTANLDSAMWPALSGGDITTWIYQASTGLLTRKQYADTQGTDYAYDPFNRLATRTWARTSSLPVSGAALVTTYGYGLGTGELTTVDYSDDTPDVTTTYDRLGRAATVIDAAGTRTFAYDPAALRLAGEALPAAFYADRVLTRTYETVGVGLLQGRASGYQLGTVATPAQDAALSYGYAGSGRLETVTAPAGTFTYAYAPNSNLRAGVTGPQIATTYTYETDRNLLAEVKNQVGATIVSRYAYTHDAIGRRQNRVQDGSAYTAPTHDAFGYNLRSEVTATNRYAGADPQVPGAEDPALARSYTFDPIGNRLTSREGTAATLAYTANTTNQYTQITGFSPPPAYDADGNQTVGGTGWFYEWDAENRLRVARDYAETPVNGSRRIVYVYDYQSRRIRRSLSSFDGTGWVPQEDRKYAYDGWNVIAEYNWNASTSTLTLNSTYTWGLDLSGSTQGAGGVGGLLAVTTGGSTYFPAYDANGNISQYINASGGIEARFDYDAFGQIVASAGSNLNRFAYRFSTKFYEETGLYYYGYRYYNPGTGRWLSRDPIEEQGGVNLYGMVGNDPSNRWDYLGLVFEGMNDGQDLARMNPGRFDAVYTGPHATFFMNATGPNTTSGQRNFVNLVGVDHTSGTTGVRMNADHQPPTALNPYRLPQSLYPQSEANSNLQGAQVRELRDLMRQIAEARVNTNIAQQNANARGLAIAMALEGLHSMMTNRFNNWYMDRALQQCAAQRGSTPAGCGVCTITITMQWEYPARSGRFMLIGPMTYSPPGGRSWIGNASGSYSRGSLEQAREISSMPQIRAGISNYQTYRTVHVSF